MSLEISSFWLVLRMARRRLGSWAEITPDSVGTDAMFADTLKEIAIHLPKSTGELQTH
jgi:hypothetical protein